MPPDALIRVRPVAPEQVPADAESAVGHESTAQVLTALLGRPVPMRRATIALQPGDRLYLGALYSPDGRPFRPPEGVLTVADLGTVRMEFREVTTLEPPASRGPAGSCPDCGEELAAPAGHHCPEATAHR